MGYEARVFSSLYLASNPNLDVKMKIISTSIGFILSFDSIKEVRGVIKHLYGMIEWIESENVPSPYLYAIFDDRIPHKEIQDVLDEIKDYGNK